jgi:hypothetical protein
MGLFIARVEGLSLAAPSRTGPTRYGWAVTQCGINRRRPVQIVACAGTSLGSIAKLFESQALPNALPALTKMPCRWHCPHQRQRGGIHQHAARNVLHSLVSSLRTDPSPFFYLLSETQDLSNLRCHAKAIYFQAVQLNVKRNTRINKLQ